MICKLGVGLQTGSEATPVSRLLSINMFACLPAGPARVQAADSIAHVERQSVDYYDECDPGLSVMSHSSDCLIKVSVNKERA